MAKKVRVHELAKELGLTNKEALDLCIALGIDAKSHSSSIEDAQGDRVRRRAESDGLIRAEQPAEPAPAKRPPRRRPRPPRRRPRPTEGGGGVAVAVEDPPAARARRRSRRNPALPPSTGVEARRRGEASVDAPGRASVPRGRAHGRQASGIRGRAARSWRPSSLPGRRSRSPGHRLEARARRSPRRRHRGVRRPREPPEPAAVDPPPRWHPGRRGAAGLREPTEAVPAAAAHVADAGRQAGDDHARRR